jgi:SAM-dependent methyltransferase
MTKSSVRKITVCRLCDGSGLSAIVDFGEVALGNNLQQTAEAARAAETYPLVLNRCSSCGHFQLADAVAPEVLYATNYTYLSGIGGSFVRHFESYAAWVQETCDLPATPFIVDVGSNDGTCLKPFKARGFTVCGVDPASMPAEIANADGVETINTFFDGAAVAEIISRHGLADIVTSHNVLAHVDDLAATFRAVHSLLKDNGYFCFEVGYFREVLSKNCFDTIYHEHLDYHHAAPLIRHLTGLGFSIENLSVNEIQGGSIRLLFRKDGRGAISAQAAAFLADEAQSVVQDDLFLRTWGEGVVALMTRFRAMVADHVALGRVIAAYGAPTKATLLMKVAGVTGDDVAYVVEDNPLKTGRYLPGSAVPIFGTDHLRVQKPDVLIIFAWNFADDIVRKIQAMNAAPVRIIVPLPELRTFDV